MDIIKTLQTELNIKYSQAEAAVKLIDEGQHHPLYRPVPQGSHRIFKRRGAPRPG